ncbi:MAG: translation elongation factor EF-1 subunit alpha [Candidatus Micrarchaeota archaeon]|nr:translation elongation factor EF-1 subunit alpha [Candidatus Micrarchaeota archaeon]MDE1804523.1 translation elongation factor EF-1 subunit alpha [Candidatus Micrarchaeota archaeon]MDE1846964.1 translation elongation factor EF-1 subunit alpha [Candidatus Micrarchaeota archaeon]
MAEKPHMNIVFIGHVDHGKSTTVGRILYETKAVSEQDLKKLKEEAAKYNKPTFEFAFVMDSLKEERERGITIDVNHKEFQSQKYYFTIIDAPGHKDFVKNMITGASQADAAVLVLSAKDGVQAQTREHAFLAKVLGITQLIVGINKIDAIEYDRVKYEDMKNQISTLLKTIGYDVSKVVFIPYSALQGDNVSAKSPKMEWYQGPTLLQALDNLTLPNKPTDKPLRLPIQDVYTISGHGTVPVGRVETGVMKPGENVIIMPANVKTDVKSIEMHHQQLTSAGPGDNVGFNIKGIDKGIIKRGDVVGPSNNPPSVAEEFTAQIVVINHPTAIAPGYTPVFHIHTAQLAATITEIVEQKDPKTGQTLKKNPEFIKNGDVAIVKIKPSRPVVVEKYTDFPQLGRFAIRDMGQTVAAGVVLEVVKKQM